MDNINTEISSQNKYTSPIHKIAIYGSVIGLIGMVVYTYASPHSLTLQQIEMRKHAEMLQAQTQIDTDNLKTLSDCHTLAVKTSKYPEQYLSIRSNCYETGRKPDILEGQINADGNKIYPGMSSGATDSSVPWGSGSISSNVKTIIYEEKKLSSKLQEREKNAPQSIIPGVSTAKSIPISPVNSRLGYPSHDNASQGSGSKSTQSTHSILSILNLGSCSIKQTEEEHMAKDSGHIYGTDIACERGKSFTVSAPSWKKSYIVKSVGNDKRLGNYIVLENGSYMFVFAHTQSPHKVGDTVYPGNQIGYTDDSGVATNVHLHFELWRQGYNITHDEMLGKGSQWNDLYSYKLLKQRGWYTGLEDATKFTQSVECKNGYSLKSYEDPKGSGKWSIGCGTSSYAGESISNEESHRRFILELESRYIWIYEKRLGLSLHERSALTAFFYNLGYNRPEFIQAVRSRDMKALEKVWKAHNQPFPKGLGIRRSAEWSEFTKK